jgi:hypothetical protein
VSRPATPDDVDAICASLPETELGITWGDRPTWVVPRGDKGRGFCLYRAPGRTAVDPETDQPYDDLLVIRCATPEEKQTLVDDEATPFFTVDHLRGSNAFLVQRSRLGEITVEELREVLTDAWLAVAPRRLAREHFPDA